jgi:hypothetical protein
MEYARHLFGLVVPVKAVCYGHGLLCKLSIADLKLIVEYTLRTAVCKVGSVSVTDDCCLCGNLKGAALSSMGCGRNYGCLLGSLATFSVSDLSTTLLIHIHWPQLESVGRN